MKPVTVLLVVMDVAGGYDLQSAGVCKLRKGTVTVSIPANGVPLQLDEKLAGPKNGTASLCKSTRGRVPPLREDRCQNAGAGAG